MAPVIIYTRQYCGFCSAAKRLLESKNIAFEERDATGNAALRSEMIDRSGRFTFPQIFVGDRHVGDCSELHALDARGELDALLAG